MNHKQPRRPKTSTSSTKGSSFESRVERVLSAAKKASRGTLSYTVKPKIRLQNRETVIPDFRVLIVQPHKRQQILLECQHRTHSSKPILHKIQHIRNKSPAKTFIFVYPQTIGSELARSLKAEGVTYCPISRLRTFLMAEATMGPMKLAVTVPRSNSPLGRRARVLSQSQLAFNSHPDAKTQLDAFLAGTDANSAQPGAPGVILKNLALQEGEQPLKSEP